MIKNDRQFSILRSRAERLAKSLEDLKARPPGSVEPKRAAFELEAIEIELAQLRKELEDYIDLQAGKTSPGQFKDLDDLPGLLIRSRIAAGLTQAQLAERLGIREQVLQRYEATDFESVSLARLREIGRSLGISDVPELPVSAMDSDAIWRALNRSGLPNTLIQRIAPQAGGNDLSRAVGAISRVARIFDEIPEHFLDGSVNLEIYQTHAHAYKLPVNASSSTTDALSGYAHYLGRVVAQSMTTPLVALPSDPLEFREEILNISGEVTVAGATEALWNHGIPVIPMSEPGGFHAGFWRHDSRPVVVINSAQSVESRWLFDILHEAGHIADPNVSDPTFETIEQTLLNTPSEIFANDYSGGVIFAGHSSELFEMVMDRSQQDLGLVQRAVKFVARNQQVDESSLALNIAYRLANDGQNWWGAAMNMLDSASDPWLKVRDILIGRIDWSVVNSLDADILERAFSLSDHLNRRGVDE